MAISFGTVWASLADTAARPAYSTGTTGQTTSSTATTFTPESNALLLAVMTRSRASAGATPTCSNTGATPLTWSSAQDQTGFNTVASPDHWVEWFWAFTGASPAAMAVTIDTGAESQTGCIVDIISFTGTHLTTPIPQSKAASQDTILLAVGLAVTLNSALQAGSAVCVVAAINDTGGITERAGWTEPANAERTYTSPTTGLEFQYLLAGNTTGSFTPGAASVNGALVMIEIAAPASGLTTEWMPQYPTDVRLSEVMVPSGMMR